MFISDPDFYPFRIQQQRQQRRRKIYFVLSFFSHKYRKNVNNFVLVQVKKSFLAKTLGIIVLFTQKFAIKL